MQFASLLSQHSSNPLEIASSDPRSRAYLREAKRVRLSSEDEGLGNLHHRQQDPELNAYHRQVASMFPKFTAVQPGAMVDLDDDEDMGFGQANTVVGDEEGGDTQEADNPDEDEEVPIGDEDFSEGALSLALRPPEEKVEIEHEMLELENSVPSLRNDYRLLDRLGTGTFSSVYKAIDLGALDRWDDTVARQRDGKGAPVAPVPSSTGRVYVAIKRIYVTSSPERIRNEIAIMELCRACRHVAQLITAFRHKDQVVVVMPYQPNTDFREYYRNLPIDGIKAYFRCMFRALRDVHSRGIIHRDVKPANFLFDPCTGTGTLCDFGLASRMAPGPSLGACLHTGPTTDHPHGRLRKFNQQEIEQIKRLQREARQKSSTTSDRIGYLEKDNRPISKANRAGTRGFRPPEVLLKCGEQTGAVDIWAAGVILLFFLVGKFPLFQASDDTEALMEIATIIGKRKMEKAATLHGRTFASNVPSITQDGISWSDFVERQNPALYTPTAPDTRYFPYALQHSGRREPTHPPTSSSPPSLDDDASSRNTNAPGQRSPSPSSVEAHRVEIERALDLAARLLEPESTKRLTPRSALFHPFLAPADGENDDDAYFPHPFGEGVCGSLHFRDEVTDDPCVRVRVRRGGKWVQEVRTLLAGEGIAVGSMPCEFHHKEFGSGTEW